MTEIKAKTILIVEDDSAVRTLLTDVLSYNGFNVKSAVSGEEAIQLLKTLEEVPSLVIIDVKLPKIDGYDLFKRIRQEHPDMKVIYISGYPKIIDEAGTHVMPKPFSITQIISRVKELL